MCACRSAKAGRIKRHVLTCSLGLVLAVLVTVASLHDTKAVAILLDRAVDAGWHLDRITVDGIYIGPTVDAAAQRHGIEVQISTRDSEAKRVLRSE